MNVYYFDLSNEPASLPLEALLASLAAKGVEHDRSQIVADQYQRVASVRRHPLDLFDSPFILTLRRTQFPHANLVAEYRGHSARLNSVFDSGPRVRVSRTTGELSRRDIREAEVLRSYLIRLSGTPMQQNKLFPIIHEN